VTLQNSVIARITPNLGLAVFEEEAYIHGSEVLFSGMALLPLKSTLHLVRIPI
jgi:hypothetical protein